MLIQTFTTDNESMKNHINNDLKLFLVMLNGVSDAFLKLKMNQEF